VGGVTHSQNFNRTYTYDALNRLQEMTAAPLDQCTDLLWTIDPWGNRTDQTVNGGNCYPFQAAVDANNHFTPQDCSSSTTGYCYDADGDLTKDNFHKYTYDAENRIIQVDGGNTATYLYDGLGNRVQKTVGGVDTEYLFDSAGRINSVFTNGSFANQFVYLNGKPLVEYSEGTTYFVHTDHLGSTRLLTKLDGTVRECDDYYPFGELNPCYDTSGDRLKFTGKERDTESGPDANRGAG
jgi:YD repeat-containing protein